MSADSDTLDAPGLRHEHARRREPIARMSQRGARQDAPVGGMSRITEHTMKVVTVAVHCPSTRLRVSRIARPQCSIRASPPPPHLAPHHRPLARPARGVHTVGRASGGESSSTCDTVAATATASAGVAAMWAVWASQGEALALRCAAGSVLALFIAVGCVPSPLPSFIVRLSFSKPGSAAPACPWLVNSLLALH
jgi:hypothetical protein